MAPFELIPDISPSKGVINFDALVCDLDGVVYRGGEEIPGSVEAIGILRERGVKVLFCTNNSRTTVEGYIEKLAAFGMEITAEDILTSAVVTAETLQDRGWAGRTAIVVGGDGIRAALGAVCISVKDDEAVTVADLVVVGWTPSFTYAEMRRAATAVRNGAALIATNGDATFPAPDGLWPGAGSILASIETASGARAEVMGKPNKPMMDAIARRLEGRRAIAMLGDRPDTDLAGGRERGWQTILVTSGVTAPETADSVEPRPDVVVGSLAELVAQLS
ncbi:MAG TPA: HAD-IIA family hydrolase [Actinomycetota bacterium]|nr:HAD-IIA family hydrolase [Actinomycetota bacterium]